MEKRNIQNKSQFVTSNMKRFKNTNYYLHCLYLQKSKPLNLQTFCGQSYWVTQSAAETVLNIVLQFHLHKEALLIYYQEFIYKLTKKTYCMQPLDLKFKIIINIVKNPLVQKCYIVLHKQSPKMHSCTFSANTAQQNIHSNCKEKVIRFDNHSGPPNNNFFKVNTQFFQLRTIK